MQPSKTFSFLRYVRPATPLVFVLCACVSSMAMAVECGDERFVSGAHTMPSHREAMAQCREQEAALIHPETGRFERVSACHDMAPSAQHGPWRYGRVGAEAMDRGSGATYAFEGLWMCKPLAEQDEEG